MTLGATAVCLAVAMLLARRVAWAVAGVVASVSMVRCALALVVLSRTGPGGYWFGFWTDPTWRSVYITVAVALFGWLFVALGWAVAAELGRPAGHRGRARRRRCRARQPAGCSSRRTAWSGR